MSERLRFRAWNVATQTMVDLRAITPLALNMDVNGVFIPDSDGLIVMQSTGLRDNNGKLIFEGDVLESVKNSVRYHVIWNQEEARFNGENSSAFISAEFWQENYIIIGNIHEHPELLK